MIYLRYFKVLLCSLLLLPAVVQAEKVNMVVTAAFVSNKGLDVYKDIATYIAKEINSDVTVISGTSYKESNLLLEQGIIQVGFICGLPYTQLMAENKLELLATPVIAPKANTRNNEANYKDKPGKYYSYTIVHKDSPINSWKDLKGKSYVYNDRNSNSGYNMPRYKLIQLGAKSWQDYFSQTQVSGSHEESIRMVANGVIDASSVDSLVLDFDRHINDPSALNVKIIETLFPGGAGAPPVVVSSKIKPALLKKLRHAFLQMHKSAEGKKILGRALLLRFDPPNDKNYDDIRKMSNTAKQTRFNDHLIITR